MAGLETTLTKDNSGTQCPHPLSNSAGAPTDGGSTALSKSKKKRLRKKKKVETANSGSTELSKSAGKDAKISKSPHVDVQQPSKKRGSALVVDVALNKQEGNSLKDTERVEKPVEKPFTIIIGVQRPPNARKAEVDLKQKTIKDTHSSVEGGSKTNQVTSQSQLKPALIQFEGSRVAMDSEKPLKDGVMAQREAKKLAKLAKKNRSGGGGTATAPIQPDPKVNQPNKSTPQTTQLPNNVPNAQNPSPVSAVTSQINQISLDDIDGEIAKPVRAVGHVATPTPKTRSIPNDQSLGVSEKPEKSREEILVEREAKKQAKLVAKTKKKEGVVEATKDQHKENQAEPVKDKSAPISGESPALDVQKDVNHVVKDIPETEKSKAALRAERRAKQEAQRAAKGGSKKDTEKTKPAAGTPAIKSESNKDKPAQKVQSKPQILKTAAAKSSSNQPKLLSHLLKDSKPLPAHICQNVHPAIVELGAKYAARVVSGSNARCIALLQALKRVIVDFVTPREKEFSRAMETRLNDSMAYLNGSRQSSVSMTNALKHVKSHLTQLTTEKTTDEDARKKLCEVIDTFIKEQIDVAGEAISIAVAQKISNGDTIAIYGCSSLLLRILVESHNEGKDFEVVVVDGGPLYEGREMCRRLVSENINCSYVLLPAFSYIVGQTTKVLLGAHALLANGCVMSRSGTAVVAMLAKAHNVPVIVCCETYKFSERVQADAFVHNELGPQDKVGSPPSISLMYDMTPPTLVDAVATELAILPCTSVPVILRVKPSDVSSYYY